MFRFRLEAVLRHRRFIEEGLQRELSQRLARLQQEQERLRQIAAARSVAEKQMDTVFSRGGTARESMLFSQYIQRLSREGEEQGSRIAGAEKAVTEKRREVVAAMKERKIMEKLKEKDRRAYEEDQRREEQKFVNDMAVIRHLHKEGPQGLAS